MFFFNLAVKSLRDFVIPYDYYYNYNLYNTSFLHDDTKTVSYLYFLYIKLELVFLCLLTTEVIFCLQTVQSK